MSKELTNLPEGITIIKSPNGWGYAIDVEIHRDWEEKLKQLPQPFIVCLPGSNKAFFNTK